jgi:hypothetical protein
MALWPIFCVALGLVPSVKAKDSDPNSGSSFPNLAELDDLELSNVDLNPGTSTSNQTGKH